MSDGSNRGAWRNKTGLMVHGAAQIAGGATIEVGRY